MKELQEAYNAVDIDKYNQISSYHDIREQLDRLCTEFRSFLTKPEYLLPFLQPGRLVKVCIYIYYLNVKLFFLNILIIIIGEKCE